MQIVLNAEICEVQAQNLLELTQEKGISREGTAIACDQEIVPASQWESFKLKENMTVDVFRLAAGG